MSNYVVGVLILIVGIFAYIHMVVSDDSIKAQMMETFPNVVASEVVLP